MCSRIEVIIELREECVRARWRERFEWLIRWPEQLNSTHQRGRHIIDTEEVGQLTRGDVILATHSQVQNGRTRLRCQRGHPIPGKGRESGWVGPPKIHEITLP